MKRIFHYIALAIIGISIAVSGWILGTQQYKTYHSLVPAPVLGIVVDKNFVVLHVEPNSAAKLAGIQIGDNIEAFDALLAATQGMQMREAIQSVHPGSRHVLHIKRADESLAIEITPKTPTFNPQAIPTPVVSPYNYY